MDQVKLLYAMGEVDDDILYFKYHLKNVIWAILMGIVTMLLCLFVAERYLGVSGFVMDVSYSPDGDMFARLNPNLKLGLWFRRVFLIVIPLLFMNKVRWRYTWVNFFVFFFLYFPMREIAGQWPCMGYLGTPTGMLSLPWIVNPLIMMVHFWGVQSLVYLAFNAVRALRQRNDQNNM